MGSITPRVAHPSPDLPASDVLNRGKPQIISLTSLVNICKWRQWIHTVYSSTVRFPGSIIHNSPHIKVLAWLFGSHVGKECAEWYMQTCCFRGDFVNHFLPWETGCIFWCLLQGTWRWVPWSTGQNRPESARNLWSDELLRGFLMSSNDCLVFSNLSEKIYLHQLAFATLQLNPLGGISRAALHPSKSGGLE